MGCWAVQNVPQAVMSMVCLVLLFLSLFNPPVGSGLSTFNTTQPWPSCPTCFQCSLNPITSTPRDLLLTYCTGKMENLHVLVSSIRSVGIRATLVLCTSSDQVIPPSIEKLLASCGVWVFRGRIPDHFEPAPIARYSVYDAFLSSFGSQYDRVLHVDAFDVYFQGDPFTDSLTNAALHVVLEGNTIGNQCSNRDWIRDCYGEAELASLFPNRIANSGTAGGGVAFYARVVKRILAAVEATKHRARCLRDGADQGHYNRMLWAAEGALTEEMPIRYHGCDSEFVTALFCFTLFGFNSFGVLSTPGSVEPVFIHQYNRFKQLENVIWQLAGLIPLTPRPTSAPMTLADETMNFGPAAAVGIE
jgi:hypothetical protein